MKPYFSPQASSLLQSLLILDVPIVFDPAFTDFIERRATGVISRGRQGDQEPPLFQINRVGPPSQEEARAPLQAASEQQEGSEPFFQGFLINLLDFI